MKLKTVKISSLKSHKSNPNQHPHEQINELQNSLDQFGQVKNIVVWQNQVIAGNGLLIAAQKQGRKEIEIQDISDWPEEKAISFMIADNRLAEIAVMDNNMLSDLLDDFDFPLDIPGIDETFLDELNITLGVDGISSEEKDDNVETLEPNEIIKEKIKQADKIIYQFSGGRDSTLVILETIELVRDKDPVACYVDTGTEFPDLLYFIYNFCQKHDLPLQVLHPKRNFFEIYGKDKCFPGADYRPCISQLINDPCDEFYCLFENALTIRGSNSKQKTHRSKSKIYMEFERKNKTIKCLNPLFAISKDEYKSDIQKINVWEGYEKGFERTACWTCPFQTAKQWNAMKVYYPMLFDRMKEMANIWKYNKFSRENYSKQFYKYWADQ